MGITEPPDETIGFIVVVKPGSLTLPCWRFVVLISKDDRAQSDKIVTDICGLVLEPSDQFWIFPYLPDPDEGLEGVGVMTFHQDRPDTFDWITVPRHMRH
jgi:hypothetical protein